MSQKKLMKSESILRSEFEGKIKAKDSLTEKMTLSKRDEADAFTVSKMTSGNLNMITNQIELRQ